MPKVVYNACYGGFELSNEALALGRELSGDGNWGEKIYLIPRHDKILVQVVESLGEKARTRSSKPKIAEIEGRIYRIEEYSGREDVFEPQDYKFFQIKEGDV